MIHDMHATLHGSGPNRGLKSMVLDLWEDRDRRRKFWAGIKATIVVSAILGAWRWITHGGGTP